MRFTLTHQNKNMKSKIRNVFVVCRLLIWLCTALWSVSDVFKCARGIKWTWTFTGRVTNIHRFSQFTWQEWQKRRISIMFQFVCVFVSVCLHAWWSSWRYTSLISSLQHLVWPVLHFSLMSLFVFHLLALFAFPTTTGSFLSCSVCLVSWSWLLPYMSHWMPKAFSSPLCT